MIRPIPRVLGVVVVILAVCAGRAGAHEGWGIVVQPDGTVYFADIPTNTIWRITAAGVLEVAARDKHSHALVRTADGNIYGTHEHTAQRPGEIWRITPNLELSTVFTAPRDFQLSLHPFLADASGTVYSSNVYAGPGGPRHLMRRTASGEVSVVANGFEGIDGMDFGADGSIYLTDGNWLRRVMSDGTATAVAGPFSAPSFGEDAMGVEVDSNGMMYVADYSGGRLLRVQPDGLFASVLETGWLWAPTGMARHDGATYVLEHLRMPLVILGNLGVGPYVRVRRVSTRGAVETLVVVWGRYSWVAGAGGALLVAGVIFLVRRRSSRSRGTK